MPGRSQGTVLQVYRVWSLIFMVDLMRCLILFVRFLVLTERASPVGWSQPTLIALVGEEL